MQFYERFPGRKILNGAAKFWVASMKISLEYFVSQVFFCRKEMLYMRGRNLVGVPMFLTTAEILQS